MTDAGDFLTQAQAFYAAMGTPLVDASEVISQVPDAHQELTITLTRAEIMALLPLIATAQLHSEVDRDPWIDDQRQWWAITRSRLESALSATDGTGT